MISTRLPFPATIEKLWMTRRGTERYCLEISGRNWAEVIEQFQGEFVESYGWIDEKGY